MQRRLRPDARAAQHTSASDFLFFIGTSINHPVFPVATDARFLPGAGSEREVLHAPRSVNDHNPNCGLLSELLRGCLGKQSAALSSALRH